MGFPDLLKRLQSVHVGHCDVHDDEVGLFSCICSAGSLAVGSLKNICISVFGERILNHHSHECSVVHKQNFLIHNKTPFLRLGSILSFPMGTSGGSVSLNIIFDLWYSPAVCRKLLVPCLSCTILYTVQKFTRAYSLPPSDSRNFDLIISVILTAKLSSITTTSPLAIRFPFTIISTGAPA